MSMINFDSDQLGMFFDYCCPQCNKEMVGVIDNDLNGDFLGIQQCENCRIAWVWVLCEDTNSIAQSRVFVMKNELEKMYLNEDPLLGESVEITMGQILELFRKNHWKDELSDENLICHIKKKFHVSEVW